MSELQPESVVSGPQEYRFIPPDLIQLHLRGSFDGPEVEAHLDFVHRHAARCGGWVYALADLTQLERITESGRRRLTREYDHVEQVLVYNLFRRWEDHGESKERTTHISIRYTWPQELNALLERTGFQVVNQYGNWDKSPLTKDSPSIISVCKLSK